MIINGIAGFEELLSKGVRLRNSGDLNNGELYLIGARNKEPDHWQPLYELAKLYEAKNNFRLSYDLSVRSLQLSGGRNARALALSLSNAIRLGDKVGFETAASISSSFDVNVSELISCYGQAKSFYDFFDEVKRKDILNGVIEKSAGWINKKQVMERIRNALDQSLGFCFVRLGDGEGTWLYNSPVDEIYYHNLYKKNKDEFIEVWFGTQNRKFFNDFGEAVSEISDRLSESDIIGVPPRSWIEHEFNILSLRGMPGTLNVYRHLVGKEINRTNLCTQLMHFELSDYQDFSDFVASLKDLTVITCHPGIPKFFKENMGIGRVEFIPVPGEPSRAHLHGREVAKGSHFPDGLEKVKTCIRRRDWAGKVCLIGAGVLGKLYALEIKRLGGIAIDVGSLMDKWMGKKTRPNF